MFTNVLYEEPETPPSQYTLLFVMFIYVLDEGPETGEDSEDDLVRSYLPSDREYRIPSFKF